MKTACVVLAVLCGLAAAQPPKQIDVYMVTHTHDDVGWILPVDQYYNQQVQFILDSAIANLAEDPARKFTYVEVGFFERWWSQINEAKRDLVRSLVSNGQLEFNLGGITMNDEATTTYIEEINQMTVGARFLVDNVGPDALPKSAWHVDPFGHSAVTASLWSQAGFPGFILDRIPTDDRQVRQDEQTLEFVWKTSVSHGAETDMWCHVLDNMYCSAGEYDFNDNDGWNGIWVQDDHDLTGYNVDGIVANFVKLVQQRSAYYRHNKLLLPYGCDFAHRESYNSFVEMDKLIKAVNTNTSIHGVSVRYAHVSDYVADVQALNLTWPTFTGDFFPYSDCTDCFWSGYFTSRPALKLNVRQADGILNTAEILFSFARATDANLNATEVNDEIEVMRQGTSICTHHDAVSGTATQRTTDDYNQRLVNGWQAVESVLPTIVESVMTSTKVKSTDSATVYAVHNSLGWARREVVAVGVSSDAIDVTDSTGAAVSAQVNPTPSYSFETSPYIVYFYAEVPPMGLATYTVTTVSSGQGSAVVGVVQDVTAATSVANEYIKVGVDATGLISDISSSSADFNVTVEVNQNLFQYRPARGQTGQASGAYIFRPETNSATDIGSNAPNNNDSTQQRKTSNILMPPSYAGNQVFVATPRGSNYNDTFIPSTRTVAADHVNINVFRADGPVQGWGQDLKLDFISWAPSEVPAGFQAGTNAVPNSSTRTGTVQITFPTAFSVAPQVFVTARGYEADDAFIATTASITTTGFTANIYRLDADSGWSQTVSVDWVASVLTNNMTESTDRFETAYAIHGGTVTVGPSSAQLATVIVDHAPSSINPLIVVSARGDTSGQVFATEIRGDPVAENFTINVWLVNGQSWTQNLQVDWMVYPRVPIQNAVVASPSGAQIVTGPIVQEIRQPFRTGYGQTSRVYTGDTDGYHGYAIHTQHSLGPIDIEVEMVTRFSTSMNTNGTIYTDDNGLEFQTRYFNYTKAELVAGNYYPMVNRAYIRDADASAQLTLLSDSTHGAGGMANGQLEVMLHRRCIDDDGRGVGETLNETLAFEPSIWAVVSSIADAAKIYRRLSLYQQFPLAVFEVPAAGKTFSPLATPLPDNVHILSFRTLYGNSSATILRVQHVFEVDEDATLSQPVKVDLGAVFAAPYTVSNVQEYNLVANTPVAQVKRPVLDYEGRVESKIRSQDPVVTLNPMDIKTYIVDFTA